MNAIFEVDYATSPEHRDQSLKSFQYQEDAVKLVKRSAERTFVVREHWSKR